MHLLLIHQFFIPPEEPGGTRHYEIARHWVARGHRFTAVTSDVNYHTSQRSRPAAPQCNDASLRILQAVSPTSLHRSFVWRVVAFVRFMCSAFFLGLKGGSPDLVMGTSPPLFQALSAWLLATVRRRPFLLEIRDLWPEFAVDMGVLKNPILIQLSTWLADFMYTQATHIVVNSPAYRDHLMAKGVSQAKITLVPNGVDPEMFCPHAKGAAFREARGLQGDFVVTYAGALGLANDIPVILRAAHQLRHESHIRFLLVGDGKERRNLEALARKYRLPNVTFIGARPKTEMPEILAASDACIASLKDIPMFRTTYPNKVFDYMAAGRPTLLAIDGVIRKVVEDAHGGIFVPPGNDRALADAVLRLSQNPTEAQAMGVAARAHVAMHFNRGKQVQAFIALAHRLVQRAESPR